MPDLAALAADPAEFRRALLVETDRGPLPLAEIMDPWQAVDFHALDPAFRRAAGQTVEAEYGCAYLERGRGASKTSDLATMATWALFASRRALRGVVAAGARDQARLLRDAIERLVRANPWLRPFVDVQAYRLANPHTGGQINIISADAGVSYGLLVDLVLVDELTHWTTTGEALWESLLSAAAKRSSCALVVIANAGFGLGTSWQWRVREAARTTPNWYFSRPERPPSWISPAVLDEQRRMLPPSAYKRLWENIWTSNAGDALEPEDIEAAVMHTAPMAGAEPGWSFLAGLDVGTRQDRTAVVVVGANALTHRVRVAHVQSWKAPRNGTVDLIDVCETIIQLHRRFHFVTLRYDPYQAVLAAQMLRRTGIPTAEVPFVGANLNEMATAILNAFRGRQIELYDCPELIADLGKLCIIERKFGWKLEADRSGGSHADAAFALAVVLPAAMDRSSHGYTGEFECPKPFTRGPQTAWHRTGWGVDIRAGIARSVQFSGSRYNRHDDDDW